MLISLAYGRHGIEVDIPDHAHVFEPRHAPGLPDEHAAFLAAVRNPLGTPPLGAIARPGQRVAIVISDMTRPTPNERLVPWILGELSHIPRSDVVIINGTGTHRGNTPAELERMLGAEVMRTVRVINHNAFDPDGLALVGEVPGGGPVYLNKEYLACDVRIVVGFIEPHFFAGFSGGPKGVCPGLGGIETVHWLHSAPLIGHPQSTWGVLDGNPVHESVQACVRLAPPDFIVNVTLNRVRQITGVYAGELVQAHRAGCADCARLATVPVAELYDVVVTTNSGYPLDQNLYQAVKGMSAAARIVRPGGYILCAAECSDGLPNHGQYRELLTRATTPAGLLQMINDPRFKEMDQWQVQVQALVQMRASVLLYSSLPSDTVRAAKLQPVPSLEVGLGIALAQMGPQARIAVLPQGPLTVPFIGGR